MGGIYATLNPEELVALHDCYDVVVLGEGEDIIVELANILAGHSDTALSTIDGIIWRDKSTGKNTLTPGQHFVRDLQCRLRLDPKERPVWIWHCHRTV